MMNVRKAVSAALLTGVALTGASGAFAAQDPTSQQVDLYVAVWNPTTSTSIVQDLGVPFDSLNTPFGGSGTPQFQNPNGFTSSWTVDNGNLATDLGAGTYEYTLFAGDDFSSPNNFIGVQFLTGIAAGTTAPTLTNGAIVSNGLIGTIAPYLNNQMGAASLLKGTGSSYFASSPNGPGVANGSLGMNGYVGQQTIGGNENLVAYVGGGTQDSAADNATNSLIGNASGAGVFNLTGSTLTYNLAGGVSGVPLPAAGWLLISGLLGLGAVGRRRDANAAV